MSYDLGGGSCDVLATPCDMGSREIIGEGLGWVWMFMAVKGGGGLKTRPRVGVKGVSRDACKEREWSKSSAGFVGGTCEVKRRSVAGGCETMLLLSSESTNFTATGMGIGQLVSKSRSQSLTRLPTFYRGIACDVTNSTFPSTLVLQTSSWRAECVFLA